MSDPLEKDEKIKTLSAADIHLLKTVRQRSIGTPGPLVSPMAALSMLPEAIGVPPRPAGPLLSDSHSSAARRCCLPPAHPPPPLPPAPPSSRRSMAPAPTPPRSRSWRATSRRLPRRSTRCRGSKRATPAWRTPPAGTWCRTSRRSRRSTRCRWVLLRGRLPGCRGDADRCLEDVGRPAVFCWRAGAHRTSPSTADGCPASRRARLPPLPPAPGGSLHQDHQP